MKTTIGEVTFEFQPETEDSQIEITGADWGGLENITFRIFKDMENEGLINTHTLYAKLEQAAIDAKNDAEPFNKFEWD